MLLLAIALVLPYALTYILVRTMVNNLKEPDLKAMNIVIWV